MALKRRVLYVSQVAYTAIVYNRKHTIQGSLLARWLSSKAGSGLVLAIYWPVLSILTSTVRLSPSTSFGNAQIGPRIGPGALTNTRQHEVAGLVQSFGHGLLPRYPKFKFVSKCSRAEPLSRAVGSQHEDVGLRDFHVIPLKKALPCYH